MFSMPRIDPMAAERICGVIGMPIATFIALPYHDTRYDDGMFAPPGIVGVDFVSNAPASSITLGIPVAPPTESALSNPCRRSPMLNFAIESAENRLSTAFISGPAEGNPPRALIEGICHSNWGEAVV